MTLSYKESIFKALEETECICHRCKLRYAGLRDVSKYRMNSDKSDAPEEKLLKVNPCIACIGVLQDQFMLPCLDKVAEAIKSNEYDAREFSMAISLPVSLSLRERSLAIFLEEKVPNFVVDDVVPTKQAWKWLFPNQLQTEKTYLSGGNSDFFAEVRIMYPEDESEINAISLMCEEEYSMRERKSKKYHMGLVTRQGIEKSLIGVSNSDFRSHYKVPPTIPSSFSSDVVMYNNNIYIGGRYNKYSRELPQTPWIIDGERKLETSIEEIIIAPFKKFFKFDDSKFYSSGREDVDTRMLGSGRPFAFEFINPRKTIFSSEEMNNIQKIINASSKDVQVNNLTVLLKSDLKILKEGEDQKTKTYRAVVVIPSNSNATLNSLNEKLPSSKVTLSQKTPIRVLHRRPNSCRTRSVSDMKFEAFSKELPPESDQRFVFNLTTEAGTYVKEFVHGDFERTIPSLRSITGYDVDIEALDVEAINIEWPPRMSESKSIS